MDYAADDASEEETRFWKEVIRGGDIEKHSEESMKLVSLSPFQKPTGHEG